jgi:hypothetical protein
MDQFLFFVNGIDNGWIVAKMVPAGTLQMITIDMTTTTGKDWSPTQHSDSHHLITYNVSHQ